MDATFDEGLVNLWSRPSSCLLCLDLILASPRAFHHQTACDQCHFRHIDTGHTIHQMDKLQVQRFKTRLETRQHELRVSIEDQLQDARVMEPEPDAVDQATRQSEKERLLRTTNKEQQILRAVELALVRIREGSFGQCVSCNNEISEARLEAVPITPYCIPCQGDLER